MTFGTVMKIGSIGERLDIQLRQGATFSAAATMDNPDGTPIDLTGSSILGQIRKKPTDLEPVATFVTAITDAVNGKYTFSLAASVTALIEAGFTLTDPQSTYIWDLELQDSAGNVTPLYYGFVQVFRAVTQ